MEEETKPKYTGRGGYHGGGRKKTTGTIRKGMHISATPAQIEQLKEQAKAAGLTTSDYILKLAKIK